MKSNTIQTLERETVWFSRVLDRQFQTYFKPEQSQDFKISSLMPPELLDTNCHYTRLIQQHQLRPKERLTLMLALMPHLNPKLLDIFFTKNHTT